MKSGCGRLLLCLLCGVGAAQMAPGAAQAASGAAPAMLTNAQGTVEVRRAGQARGQAASLMALLRAGDQVRTGSAATASLVFFADGHREQLLAASAGTVTASTLKPLPGSRRVTVASGGRAPTGSGRILVFRGGPKLAAGYSSAAGRAGAIALRAEVTLLSPLGPTIRERRPALRWSGRDDADLYRVRLFARGQEPPREVFALETPQTQAAYPEGAPDLEPGTEYAWEIEPCSQGIPLPKSSGTFRLLDARSCQQLERDEAPLRALARTAPRDATAPLLLASLCTKHDLLGEAIAHYRRALALRPDDPGIHFELGWLCRHVGLDATAHFTAAGVDPVNPPLRRE